MSFDEVNLVPNAGLLPAAVLAQRLGLAELVDARVRLARHGANGGAKALTVIASMLAGGDCIDDVAVLRSGAAGELFDATRAPSTVGSWLRGHKWSNVRELDAVSRELLARLWAAGAGPANLAGPLTIDLDSTIVEVHGRAKQGAAFGYTKVRGYSPQLATCAQTGQVLFARLRGGSAGAARGARSFLTETISRTRGAGASGQLTVRADSAFYSRAVLSTAKKFDVRFSVTVRQDKRVRAAIEALPEEAWAPIPYWLSTPEVSGADIAETDYTCFPDTRHALPVRLVVRRVRPTPGSQLALFTTWDYHAFVTDQAAESWPLAEVEADHRRHAVIEGDHRRAEVRRSGAPALWALHGQCRLAGAGRDGAQPRPRRRPARRARPAPSHRHHPAAASVHRSRPARAHRPATTPPPARVLALGPRRPHRAERDRRDPAALLTPDPHPCDPDPEGPADRQRLHAPNRNQRPAPTRPRSAHPSPRSAVDPGLGHPGGRLARRHA